MEKKEKFKRIRYDAVGESRCPICNGYNLDTARICWNCGRCLSCN